MSLNVIALCGRMVRDPEVKNVAGKSCANFTIAVDRNYRGADKEKITDFFDCTAWRQTADFVGRYCRKGREVTVSGSMESRKWTDKDGNRRISWYVNCEGVNGVGGKQDGQEPAGQAGSSGLPQNGFRQDSFGSYPSVDIPGEDYALLTDDDAQLPF